MPPLLSIKQAEAFWTFANFFQLALAWVLYPSRVHRSKEPLLLLPNTKQDWPYVRRMWLCEAHKRTHGKYLLLRDSTREGCNLYQSKISQP